jgi:hypothetical protein
MLMQSQVLAAEKVRSASDHYGNDSAFKTSLKPISSLRKPLRVLCIAYTRYLSDGRVRRHAEALANRGDKVSVIALGESPGFFNDVNLIPLDVPRYLVRATYDMVRSIHRFSQKPL